MNDPTNEEKQRAAQLVQQWLPWLDGMSNQPARRDSMKHAQKIARVLLRPRPPPSGDPGRDVRPDSGFLSKFGN